MNPQLKRETAKLKNAWMQYDEEMLRDYLVEQMEDPRLNVQSILTRHFLLESLFGDRFGALKAEELKFATAMNWLLRIVGQRFYAEDARELLFGLSKKADNVGGIEIPHYISSTFASLPKRAEGMWIPNYIKEALQQRGRGWARSEARHPSHPKRSDGVLGEQRQLFGKASSNKNGVDSPKPRRLPEQSLETFQALWRQLLSRRRPKKTSVLEPACGSANDYRFLDGFGLARLIDYTGFDLCEKNVRNARKLFPERQFKVGNAFQIHSPAHAYHFTFVHDLFEHLSLKGLETAIAEICRVTRHAICAHFFNMQEIEEHVINPVDDYHWNTLSMARTRELFLKHAASVQVTHIGTFLRWCYQCPDTYNEGAYTFLVRLEP